MDGLIVDEDVNRAYVYEDRRASAAITAALKAAAAGQGTLEELLADTPALATAMATATTELEGKVCACRVKSSQVVGRCSSVLVEWGIHKFFPGGLRSALGVAKCVGCC